MNKPVILAVSLGLLASAMPANPPTIEEATPIPPPHGSEKSFERPSPGDEGVLATLLCQGREGCELVSSLDAGTGEEGNQLTVVELKLPDIRQVRGMEDLKGGRACRPYPREWWVVVGNAAEVVAKHQLLGLCTHTGEYGARGMAEDRIEVKPNLLVHTRHGGSSWTWTTITGLRLSPLRTVFQRSTGATIHGPNRKTDSWNWETFRGRVSWFSPPCESLCKPEDRDCLPVDWGVDHAKAPRHRYAPIPWVRIDPAPGGDAWKDFSISSCSLAVDSGGKHGYVIHGEPGIESDAAINVVMLSPREMLVEVSDDLLISEANSWVFADHVELWMGKKPNYMDICQEKTAKLRQWGIRLSDNRTIPAYGSPDDLPKVERIDLPRSDGGKTVRLKVTLPDDAEGLTVVYSDSDDGKAQERLIATSDFEFGNAAALGAWKEIPADMAVCEVVDGRLEVRRTETFPPDGPALQ